MPTYQEADRAVYGYTPEELFEFSGGFSGHYTSGQRPTTYNFVEYVPEYIKTTSLKWTDDITQQAIELEVKANHPLARDFIAASPPKATYLTLRRRILGINEFRVIWRGVIVSPEINGELTCTLRCEPVLRGMGRMGLRPMYQIPCRHPLYGSGCGLLRDTYRRVATVVSISGVTIELSGISMAGLVNGEFVYQGFSRMIYDVLGNSIVMSAAMPRLSVGSEVDVYPGCAHTVSACQSFNNTTNFGGFPWIPTKNPFTGDALA